MTGWPSLYSSTDFAFYLIVAISVVLLVGVMATLLFFVFRYSSKRTPAEGITRPAVTDHNLILEIVWTAIPTLLVIFIFWVGWKGFIYKRTVPAGAMQVNVTAKMWSWSFQYENGKQSPTLKVPLGKPVKLLIRSTDVLHSLFIPAFRVKEDAVPGLDTYLWFQADKPGSFDIFCTELCGIGHAGMTSKVEVAPEQEFTAWYRSTESALQPSSPAGVGEKAVRERGCIACHTTDGTARVGPTFKGLWGKKETVLRNGGEVEVTIDSAYVKGKLFEPETSRVKGYPPIMPSQKGIVTEQESDAIVEYLKSLQ